MRTILPQAYETLLEIHDDAVWIIQEGAQVALNADQARQLRAWLDTVIDECGDLVDDK